MIFTQIEDQKIKVDKAYLTWKNNLDILDYNKNQFYKAVDVLVELYAK